MSERRVKKTVLNRKLTLRLNANHLEELELYAMKEGINVSFIVRHLVCRFLEQERRRGFGFVPDFNHKGAE
jgi:hypothetical protein